MKKKTIIMVTHDVQEAFELGDRICLMDAGKIVQQGTPADLLFKPKNKFVVDFLKEQRLQLEFKAIKPPPPPEGGTLRLNGEVLPFDVSLWWVMEQFKFKENESISVYDDQDKEIEKLGFEDLMSVFYQYKQQHSHE